MNTHQILIVEDNLSFAVKVERHLKEWGHKVTGIMDNSEDVFDARILAKSLKEEIAFRVRQYSYCIMNNTKNYKEWLEEDYERKLRSNISKKFADLM